MILFKRVSESFRHIEDREWVLLALETLGVVAGILIAFELNEWAASRSDAQRQRQLLERLFEESEATVAVLRDDRDTMNMIVDREKNFATDLVHRNRCPPAQEWAAVDTLPMYPTISVPTTVYQEIMGSGGLSRIQDREIRNSVSIFHAYLGLLQGQNDSFRNHLNYPVKIEDPRVTYDFDASADETEVSHYQRAALCSDHKFRNGIADSTRDHLVIAGWRAGAVDYAIKMCAVIGSELGRTCKPAFGKPLAGADAQLAKRAVAKANEARRSRSAPSP